MTLHYSPAPPPPFLFGHFLGRFWLEKGIWSKTKGSRLSTHFVVNWISKDFGSRTSQFFSHWSETSFQKNFISVFQVWLLTTPVYLKKKDFTNRCRIQFWIDWNLFGIEKIVCPFPFALCCFRHSLIETQFFRNSGHFRWSKSFISNREEAKKNSRLRQKSLQNYLQRKILRRKRKKLVFIIYFFYVYCMYLSISI